MGTFRKYVGQISYWGLKNSACRAWEKLIVDRKRFRSGMIRHVPTFPVCPESAVPNCDTDHMAAGRTIFYLIHYFYPKHRGGTERFLLNLASAQKRNGNRVIIFTLGTEKLACYKERIGDIYYSLTQYAGLTVVEYRYAKTPLGLIYKNICPENTGIAPFVQYWLDKSPPSLIHCVYPQPFAEFLRICHERRVPYLVTLTDFNIFCHYATLIEKNGALCVGCDQGRHCSQACSTYAVNNPPQRYQHASALLADAAFVTVPSKFVANVIYQEFPGIRPVIIPHGISSGFYPAERRELGPVRKFAYFGTISRLKGVHLLIQAFCALPEPELSLHIFGDGDPQYLAELHKLAGEDARIHFKAGITAEHMPDAYRQIDCVVIPSMWYETYNFVVRESLISGCLVVVSKIGAMPEAVFEGANGFLFDVGNVEALAAALKRAALFHGTPYVPPEPTVSDEVSQYDRLYEGALCRGATGICDRSDL